MVVRKKEAMPPPMITTASALEALVVEFVEHDMDVFSSRSLPSSLGSAERGIF
jgi:hypothetical protein